MQRAIVGVFMNRSCCTARAAAEGGILEASRVGCTGSIVGRSGCGFLRREPASTSARRTHQSMAMAAVFALVFIPALASACLMFKVVQGDVSLASAMAGATFIALAAGIFYGVLRMARQWENEAP
jgi:hypothetical protein